MSFKIGHPVYSTEGQFKKGGISPNKGRYLTPREIVSCRTCGEMFETSVKSKRIYCSRSCAVANRNKVCRNTPWNKGLTKETDLRVAAAALKDSKSCKGKVPWNKGLLGFNSDYPRSKEWIAKRVASHIETCKNRVFIYRGKPSGYDRNFTWILRETVREEYGRKCFECVASEANLNGFYKKLDVHHKDGDKKNCDKSNLIPLCRSCHTKYNFKMRREKLCA